MAASTVLPLSKPSSIHTGRNVFLQAGMGIRWKMGFSFYISPNIYSEGIFWEWAVCDLRVNRCVLPPPPLVEHCHAITLQLFLTLSEMRKRCWGIKRFAVCSDLRMNRCVLMPPPLVEPCHAQPSTPNLISQHYWGPWRWWSCVKGVSPLKLEASRSGFWWEWLWESFGGN